MSRGTIKFGDRNFSRNNFFLREYNRIYDQIAKNLFLINIIQLLQNNIFLTANLGYRDRSKSQIRKFSFEPNIEKSIQDIILSDDHCVNSVSAVKMNTNVVLYLIYKSILRY